MRSVVARRILVLFLFCSLLPIGSLAVLSLREMSGNLKKQTEQRLRHASKNVNLAILQGLSFLQAEMEALSLSSGGRLRKAFGEQENNPPFLRDHHFLGLTHFRERSGAETLFGTPCPPPPRTEGIRKHLASGHAMVFVREVPDALSRVYMVVASDRRNPDQGFLVGEVHPKYLREIIENAIPAEGNLTILDSTGGVLYSSRFLPTEVTRRVGDKLRRTHASQFEWNRGDETYLVNSRSIFLKGAYLSEDWTVIVNQSKAEAFAPVQTFTRRFVLIIGFTVLVVLLLSIGQIRKNLSPLEKLRDGTRRISKGEFESRVDIESGDEFEELALSFNTMSERLGIQFRALSDANVRMEREIADRKRVEEQLLHSQKMEAIGQFTGGIAHDFSNLLMAINGYSGILLERLGADDTMRKEIQGINDAGERAASLVSQLLTFSRKKVHEQKVVNLNRLISDIDRIFRRMIPANINVVWTPEEELGSARIDPGLMEQVIVNLAVNARDAMPDGGALTIETANRDIDDLSVSLHPVESPGRYVTLRVSDTGCGMDEKTRSRIFEPFFTTKPSGKGTGLGLSTVYGIVQQSEGHIFVDSEVGKGATFTVYLPRVEAMSEERQLSEEGAG
jgi:signal transduction histidine kinase